MSRIGVVPDAVSGPRPAAMPAAITGAMTGAVPGAVEAAASIVAEHVGTATRVRLRSSPPLVLRRTAPGVVHLVGVGGGPVAGDRLRYRVQVAAGAHLTVRQVAATVALPSPSGDAPSVLRVDVDVAAGASLDWLGEPTVAARGCHHEVDVRVVLAADASLRWREEVIAGRYREETGRLRSRLTVTREDRVVLRSDTTIGDRWWLSPAVAGGARVLGTALLVGDRADRAEDPGAPGQAAVAHLDDRLVLVQALADDHPTVRRLLARAAGTDTSDTSGTGGSATDTTRR